MDDELDDLTADVSVSNDQVATIRLKGEIDIVTSHILERAGQEAVDGGSTRLVIDMSEITFMDSSGIVALIRLRSCAPVTIRRPSEPVRQLIIATGLTDTFDVES
jgi:anti-anti-sigma factor